MSFDSPKSTFVAIMYYMGKIQRTYGDYFK